MADKKAELKRCGWALFSEKGFKDTAVADITGMAGVGVGTFYSYYPSKEKLFMEIYLEENRQMSQNLLAQVDLNGDPIPLIRRLLALNMEGMKASPILRQWFDQDVSGRLEKLFREENGLNSVDFLYGTFHALVKRWQAEGRMRGDIGCDMIMAMFEAIIRVGMHREEIGLQFFPMLQEHLTEFVLKGLTDCRGGDSGEKIPG